MTAAAAAADDDTTPIYYLFAGRRMAVRFVGQDYDFAVVGAAVEEAAGTPPDQRRWIVGAENLPDGARVQDGGVA